MRSRRVRLLVLGASMALCSGLSACGSGDGKSDPPPQGDGDAGGDGDGAGDGDGDGDAGGDGDTRPILERTGELAYTCSVSQGLLNYTPRVWSFGSAALSAWNDAAWVARVESEVDENGFPSFDQRFLISTVAADGALGEAREIAVTDASVVSTPELLPLSADAMAMVWVEGEGLRFARVNPAGEVSAPVTLPSGPITATAEPSLARLDDGTVAVAFRRAEVGVGLLLLDEQGTVKHELVPLGKGRADATPVILPVGDHFSLLWSELPEQIEDGTYPSPEVYYAQVDAEGKVSASPRQVSALAASGHHLVGSFFSPSRVALVAVGDGFLAAWPKGKIANVDGVNPTGAYTVMLLAKLDAQGELVGEPVPLSAVMDSVDDVEPDLMRFGEQVALFWARGSHIYVCGGCVPDHDVHAVLLDPSRLVPTSNVVEVASEQGGLLRRDLALLGDDVYSTMEITFHTSSQPAFAAFHCEE